MDASAMIGVDRPNLGKPQCILYGECARKSVVPFTPDLTHHARKSGLPSSSMKVMFLCRFLSQISLSRTHCRHIFNVHIV